MSLQEQPAEPGKVALVDTPVNCRNKRGKGFQGWGEAEEKEAGRRGRIRQAISAGPLAPLNVLGSWSVLGCVAVASWPVSIP